MKKFKKILSLVLASVMSVMCIANASAATIDNNVTVLVNNEEQCVVREITDSGMVIATNDKASGILTIDTYDANGSNVIATQSLNLNTIAENIENEIPDGAIFVTISRVDGNADERRIEINENSCI